MYCVNFNYFQTAYTLAWVLYNLANNPEIQEKLHSEVQSTVGSSDTVTPTHISNMPYLRDCIKETLRYIPIESVTSGFARYYKKFMLYVLIICNSIATLICCSMIQKMCTVL